MGQRLTINQLSTTQRTELFSNIAARGLHLEDLATALNYKMLEVDVLRLIIYILEDRIKTITERRKT